MGGGQARGGRGGVRRILAETEEASGSKRGNCVGGGREDIQDDERQRQAERKVCLCANL